MDLYFSKDNADLPRPVCLKATELRKLGFDNLREYLQDPGNVHICRRGRIFIGSGGSKTVFTYGQSPWANPYKVGDKPGSYTLEESLRRYYDHLDALLTDANHLAEFRKLLSAKSIGCFCPLDQPCHRVILLLRLRAEAEIDKQTESKAKRAKIETEK